ncbi:MAG: hypothetical protein LUD51_05160 [Clostridia bacterium]|nr:hypothetical protein [Clostridia bacterium]
MMGIFGNIFGRKSGRKSSGAKRDDTRITIHRRLRDVTIVKGAPMSFEEANRGHCNPYYWMGRGHKSNCQACIAACIARLRGFRVRAQAFSMRKTAMVKLSKDTSLAYLTDNGLHPNQVRMRGEDYLSNLNKVMNDGDVFSVQFLKIRKRSGHICIAMKERGDVFLYDPQKGTVMRSVCDIDGYMRNADKNTIQIMNLTHVSIDTNFCGDIFKKAKR